eukprot:GILJ01001161.1.p1 GENE.GILJ01001161.1~~GILJ01001161.1.p1  ORF type:complete len:190 (-),score=22.74 GILJ01001161.1:119-688(-)
MAFDLVSHFASYGAYHNNKTNKIIHIIFVPMIVWSLILLLRLIPFESLLSFPVSDEKDGFEFHWGAVVLAMLLLYYYALDFGVGLVATAKYGMLYYAANLVYNHMGSTSATRLAIAVQIISWTFQFIGHGVFEGRRPALFDNIFQTLVAPFFVTLEIMFLLGYKPKLRRQCENKIEAFLRQVNVNKKAK